MGPDDCLSLAPLIARGAFRSLYLARNSIDFDALYKFSAALVAKPVEAQGEALQRRVQLERACVAARARRGAG